MSRPTVGWLRVAAFPERVQQVAGRNVVSVLPDPPKNGHYPAQVYIAASFLVFLDYALVAAATVAIAAALSVNGVAIPADPVGGLSVLVAIAAVVHVVDAGVSRVRPAPLDEAVAWLLRPARGVIRRRLVTFEMVSPRDTAVTARPTPVTGLAGNSETATVPSVTKWGTSGSFPPENRERTRLPFSKGDRFRSYIFVSEIGQGALSTVWKAEAESSGETVALKMFDPAIGENTRRQYEADFMHEAKVLRRLGDHEHIVTLHDSGTEPYPWVALEYVEAGMLRDRLPVSVSTALAVLLAAMEAIEYAHGKDITHTDLKPENILYSEAYFGRQILVTDWGKRPVVNPDLEPMLSRPYAAPEQFDVRPTNEPEAERIDIYQLGILGYELFTGTQPFLAAGEEADTERRVKTEVPSPPSEQSPGLPASLDEVLLTAIEKNPDDRYRTVAEFRAELLDALAPAARGTA